MPNLSTLKQRWSELSFYERFEQIVSCVVMGFIAIVIVYSVILTGIELAVDFSIGRDFMEKELLQDVFGSILTILILLEFNHSIFVSLTGRIGIIQARIVVLIAILVIARKIILLDFKTASIQTLAAHSGVALALGLLYWLMGHASRERAPAPPSDKLGSQSGGA